MNFTKIAFTLVLASVQGKIIEEGLWTDHDWNDGGYSVENGVLSCDNDLTERRSKAPQAIDGEVENWDTKANVVRVKSVLDEDFWNSLFPMADSFYTYENFLKAVAKWPHFCNDWYEAEAGMNTEDFDNTCKRELATLFAHIAMESDDLQYVSEADVCAGDSYCDNVESSTKYPATSGVQYYGRGPLNLKGNELYGRFSEAYGPTSYDNKFAFLDEPDISEEDGLISMASAIWLYMTPIGKNPSMHDVMTKYWMPNTTD